MTLATSDPALNDTDLPEGWTAAMLGQVLTELETGSRPKGGVRGVAEGVPSIGGEHLADDGGFRFESVKFVPRNYFDRMTRGHIRARDILVVKDGATTGKVSLVREEFPYDPAVVNEHVFICRTSPSVDAFFVFYFLWSEQGQERILENFRGSAQGGINQGFVEGTIVPMAPLAEQQRIAVKVEELLERANAARERLARMPVLLKRFRQSVLASACSGRLTADWRGLPAENGDLPSGWEMAFVSDFVVEPLRNGRSVITAAEGFPVLRLTCLKNGRVDLSERKLGAWSEDEARPFFVQTGDFLVARGNGSLSLVGRGGLVEDTPDRVAYPDLLIRVRPSEECDVRFLRLIWDSPHVREQIVAAAKTTAGIHKVSQQDISRISVPLPPPPEQHEIVYRAEALFALADTIEARVAVATARAEKLTQSILAKAFRGELVPTEAELALREGRDYEPASVLLERIRAVREQAPAPPKRAGLQTALKSPSTRTKGTRAAPKTFQEAAVLALLVHELAEAGRANATRFQVQKHVYFLGRKQGEAPDAEFTKHAAGPYNPRIRYGGAENIAKRKGWLIVEGTRMTLGPAIGEALPYARRYVEPSDIAWVVEQFASYRDVALERWATVDYAAYELAARGQRVSAKAIVAYLQDDPTWAPKLAKPGFSEEDISKTLAGLRRCGLVSVDSPRNHTLL